MKLKRKSNPRVAKQEPQKRLFSIRRADGSMFDVYFANKQKAKRYRDDHPGTFVTLGPDHYKVRS